jgi:beta-lactam-binding protein with PASTA domain
MLAGIRQFTLGRVTTRVTGDFKPGLVIAQRPAAGTQAPNGTSIDIMVAESKADLPVAVPTPTVAPFVVVPKVVGLKLNVALSQLAKIGLQYKISGREGSVISQGPPPGTKVPRGTVIRLTVKGAEAN